MIIDWQKLLTIDNGKKPSLSDWLNLADGAVIHSIYLGEKPNKVQIYQLFLFYYGGLAS